MVQCKDFDLFSNGTTAKHARDIHYITGIVETVKMVGIGRNSRNFIK